MTPVMVRYLKYPDALHWHFELSRVGDDRYGVWLGGVPGTVMRRGNEEPKTASGPFMVLIPEDRWWTVTWNHLDGDIEMYVDINTPPTWNGDTVEMIDLDLDVVRRGDGPVEVWDEDEFALHSELLAYPQRLIDAARTTTAEVVLAIGAGQEPFAEAHTSWMSAVIGGTGSA